MGPEDLDLERVIARLRDELADALCLCDERQNALDDLSAAHDNLRALAEALKPLCQADCSPCQFPHCACLPSRRGSS
jgi:hypothetical protein